MEIFKLFGSIFIKDTASKSLDKIDKKGKDTAKGFESTSSKVGKALAGAFTTTAVIGFEKAVVGTYSTYDDQMRKVQAVSGATGAEFQQLQAKAEDLGSKTRFSATQAGEGMENLARAGWKTDEVMAGIGETLTFATANSIDLGQASSIVANGLSQFGMKAQDAGKFTDILSATASSANTDIGLLGESFKYAGPVAGSLGYKLQDVSVALGLMANKGIVGSQAGTTLRSALTALANPTGNSAKAIDKLGISLTDSSGKVKPFSALLQDIRSKFSTLTDAQKAQYASTIFGQQAMSGMLSIINASPAEFDKMTKSIGEADGITQRMADTMDGGMGGALASVSSAWENLLIQIGKFQNKAITGALNLLALTLQKLPDLFALVGSAMSSMFSIITNNPIVNGIVEPFKALKGEMSDLSFTEKVHQALSTMFPNGSIMVSEFVGAIEFGIKGFIELIKGNVDKARNMFSNIFPDDLNNAFRVDLIMSILGNIKSNFENVMNVIRTVVSVALQGVGLAFELVGKVWVTVGPTIVDITLTVVDIVTKLGSIVGDVISKTIELIGSLVGWLKDHEAVVTVLVTAVGILTAGIIAYNSQAKIMSAMTALAESKFGLLTIKTKLYTASQALMTTGTNIANIAMKGLSLGVKGVSLAMGFLTSPIGIVTVAVTAFATVAVLVYQNWDKVSTWLVDTWNNIKEVTSEVWNNVMETISGVVNGVVEVITSIWGTLVEVISAIFDPIIEFISNAWENIKTIFQFALELIKGLIDTYFKLMFTAVKIPLELIKALIETIWNYIGDYIKTALNAIWNVVKSVWDGIKNFMTTVLNGIKGVVMTVWNAISSFMTTVLNAIKNVVMTVWNNIKSFITTVLNAIKGIITTIWNAIKGVIDSVLNAIKGVVTTVWNNIKETVTNVMKNIQSVISGIWNAIKGVVSEVVNVIKGVITDVWNSILGVTKRVWDGVKTAMTTPVHKAQDLIKIALDKIKGFFSSLKLKFPKIEMPELPHFRLEGKFSLKPPSVPKLAVDWYSDGCIFPNKTLLGGIGVGDLNHGHGNNAEAVLPLNVLWSRLDNNFDKLIENINNKSSGERIQQNITINSSSQMSYSDIARANRKELEQLLFRR